MNQPATTSQSSIPRCASCSRTFRKPGVESPAFVARRSAVPGIFGTYARVFDSIWARGKEVGA